MEIKFTDEQLNMLLENKTFMEGLTTAVCNKITETSWDKRRYEILVDRLVNAMKGDLTRSMINNRIIKNEEIIAKIDKKVEDSVQKIITTTIGRMIFKELMQKESSDNG